MVRALHAAGIEVILDVVYNHTGRRQPARARRSRSAASTTPSYYRLSPDDRALLHGLHRLRQHAQHAPSARAAADHGQPALLGRSRCTSTGSASISPATLARELHDVDQLGAFFDIIHQDPVLSQVKLIAEPWDLGEGGYQVGNFPVLLDGVERQVPRHACARFWKGDGGTVGEFATRLTGIERSVRAQRPAAVREHQLRHLPRRLHAARSGQLQRQAQRGQRRRQPRRRTTTTSAGTAASKARPTTRRSSSLRDAAEAQLPRDAVVLAGRADAARRRRDRPHAARQQQRLLPGQRDLLARLGARPSRGASCSTSPAV